MNKSTLTDRERILLYVIKGLETASILCPHGNSYDENSWKNPDGRIYGHFARYRQPKPGDLVMGTTGFARGVHEYSIGFYVESLPDSMGGAVIREIGSQRLCNYSNEIFVPIAGLSPLQLLEGDKYLFYQKVLQAFAKGDEYVYRFGGLDFEGQDAIIWVREVFGGLLGPKSGQESVPFNIKIPWNKKTSIKQIMTQMRAGGYGTKQFERRNTETPSTA